MSFPATLAWEFAGAVVVEKTDTEAPAMWDGRSDDRRQLLLPAARVVDVDQSQMNFIALLWMAPRDVKRAAPGSGSAEER